MFHEKPFLNRSPEVVVLRLYNISRLETNPYVQHSASHALPLMKRCCSLAFFAQSSANDRKEMNHPRHQARPQGAPVYWH